MGPIQVFYGVVLLACVGRVVWVQTEWLGALIVPQLESTLSQPVQADSDDDGAVASYHGMLSDQRGPKQPKVKSVPRQDAPRVAIYMTTHLSEEHVQFLERCWPSAVRRFQLLREADLIFYTSSLPPKSLLESLGFRNVIVREYQQPREEFYVPNGKRDDRQVGAMQAMLDPYIGGWFDDYDWIIRLNPDVLLRDDRFLREAFSDPSVDAVIAVCHYGKGRVITNPQPVANIGGRIQTDFTAFRPSILTYQTLLETRAQAPNAEKHLTDALASTLRQRRYRLLPGSVKQGFQCRVGGQSSPVVHAHELVEACPNYYDVHDKDGLW